MTPIELNAAPVAAEFGDGEVDVGRFFGRRHARPAVPGGEPRRCELGHLARQVNDQRPQARSAQLPAGFAERFNKSTAGNDDAASFPGKSELMDAFTKVRAASVEAVKLRTPADMDHPAPNAPPHGPHRSHRLVVMLQHTAMHIGQFQVQSEEAWEAGVVLREK